MFNKKKGESFIVCGLGASLGLLKNPGSYNTIGVNDIGKLFVPDYLIVVNPKYTFKPDRWKVIRNTNPDYFISQYRLRVRAKHYIQITLGKYNKASFKEKDVIHYSNNSPYLGINLAVYLGAKVIGLIGVDFINKNCFGKNGRHPLAKKIALINDQYARLNRTASSMNVKIINLSPLSRITAFQKGDLSEIKVKNGPDE